MIKLPSAALTMFLCVVPAWAQTWQSQGPAPALDGQSEGMTTQRNPVTGAVRVVLPHPSDPNILYAGTVNGGVWKTTNATALTPSWMPLTDTQDSLSIGALAFDPFDQSSQTLIAGIGRFSSLAGIGGNRIGLIKTIDGGATWTRLAGTALNERNIASLAIRGPIVLVAVNAGTQIGLYRSEDGGDHFTNLSGASGTGVPTGAVAALIGDPGNVARFYCGITGTNGGVYRSDNFGVSWFNISTGLQNPNRTDNVRLAIHNSESDNVVWASLDSQGELAGVYRLPNFAGAWESLGVPTTNEGSEMFPCMLGANPGGQGTIHMSLAADPNNPTVVYVGGDRQPGGNCDGGGFPNSIGAEDYSGRLFRGDSGALPEDRWRPLTHSGTGNNTSPHADSRSLAFDAAGNLIEGDDGGIYKRVDPNSPLADWVAVLGDACVGEFHSVAWDHNARVAFGGTQDTGSSEQIAEGSRVWRSTFSGDGGKVAVDSSEIGQSYRYGSAQYLGGFHRRLVNSSNNTIDFVFPDLFVEGLTPPQDIFAIDGAQFYSPIATNQVFGPGLALLTARHAFVSYNRGATVRDLGTPGGTPGAIVFGGCRNGVENPHVVWLGSTNGRLFFKEGLNDDLAQVTSYPGSTAQRVRAIAVSPSDYGTVIVADTSRVYMSRSLGQEWTDITGDLVDSAIRGVAYLARPQVDLIVIGGISGVYATPAFNPGLWSEFAPGLPNSPIQDLRSDPVDRVLTAALLGRGVWTLDTTPCPADFNLDGGVDGADVEAFFVIWEASGVAADVNFDGGVDGADVEYFFRRWQDGGC